jgi:hypothetical protein
VQPRALDINAAALGGLKPHQGQAGLISLCMHVPTSMPQGRPIAAADTCKLWATATCVLHAMHTARHHQWCVIRQGRLIRWCSHCFGVILDSWQLSPGSDSYHESLQSQ